MKEMKPTCARCPHPGSEKMCNIKDGKGLANCPILHKKKVLEESIRLYDEPETLRFARNATIQEGECYQELNGRLRPVKPRILEIAEFAQKMKYQKLGFIFCEGLAGEAKVVDRYFKDHDFDVISVVCKAGRTPKEQIGILDDQKIVPGTIESMCNPIFQAGVVNDEKVDFTILMGLCVGHDSLVIKHLDAPVTILAVKDRLLGHNPLAAVYNLDSYYSFLK